MDNQNLKQIFCSIKERRDDVFAQSYNDFYRKIYGIAFAYCKNEEISRDVVQNIMLKLLTLPEDKFPTSGELSWLYTVAKNETLGMLRHEKPHEDIDAVEIPAPKTEIEDYVGYWSETSGRLEAQA